MMVADEHVATSDSSTRQEDGVTSHPSERDPGQRPPGVAPSGPLDADPDELAAAIIARRELGPDAERAVITEFLNSTGAAIDARVAAELARYQIDGDVAQESARRRQAAFRLAVTSILLGILATGVAEIFPPGQGTAVAIVAWAVIMIINLAFGTSHNTRGPR
jgi:hypothetical protein